MQCSRRKMCFWIPSLLSYSTGMAAQGPIPSTIARFEDLPVHSGAGHAVHPILEGKTHSGYPIEIHETDLEPGAMPHPPHHHAHEEVFLMREGTLEVTIDGRSSRLSPGSVAYVASNEEHGVKNPGPSHAQYFVIALGSE